MTSYSRRHTELSLAVARSVVRASRLKETFRQLHATTHADELHDHRTAVAGDLSDALDLIEPGLGSQWMAAMYPEVDFSNTEGVPA